jgi:hypothetical protein
MHDRRDPLLLSDSEQENNIIHVKNNEEVEYEIYFMFTFCMKIN